MKIYAGIGSRQTPRNILIEMRKLAEQLASAGWALRSGGAYGADSAFAKGCGRNPRTIYLPWNDYNNLTPKMDCSCYILQGWRMEHAYDIASCIHPAWDRCSQGVRKLHARNVAIILGPDFNRPANAVICWTPEGRITGGTGLGIKLALEHKIPIYNFASLTASDILSELASS